MLTEIPFKSLELMPSGKFTTSEKKTNVDDAVATRYVRTEIADYSFTENQDFIVFSNSGKNRVGRHRKDYHLTLDTAKELTMVDRSDKGRQIRRYFIECEKQLHQQSISLTPAKPVVKTRREEIYYENDIPVARRPIADGEILMHPDSCLEHVMRCGFVIIPCDGMGKMTLDELWLMAEETKKLRDRVRKSCQELAEKYDF